MAGPGIFLATKLSPRMANEPSVRNAESSSACPGLPWCSSGLSAETSFALSKNDSGCRRKKSPSGRKTKVG